MVLNACNVNWIMSICALTCNCDMHILVAVEVYFYLLYLQIRTVLSYKRFTNRPFVSNTMEYHNCPCPAKSVLVLEVCELLELTWIKLTQNKRYVSP